MKVLQEQPNFKSISYSGAISAIAALVLTASCASTSTPKEPLQASQVTQSGQAVHEVEPTDYDRPVSLKLSFKYHIEDQFPEQDVFIERQDGSGQVFRAGHRDRNLKAPLFASAEPVEHNPFDPKAEGPYDKGRDLGLTLGQWLGADGEATYSCQNGSGKLSARFSQLVPDGVYTMWHFFMAMPPTTPFTGTYDLPLGERDGTQSRIQADAKGTASFEREFKPCLQLSGEHLASGLALTWHSDGHTYGVEPGDFGTVSHVQMYAFLPPREGL